MTTPGNYVRCSVDLDTTGGPVGASILVVRDGVPRKLTVLEAPAPFDTPAEVWPVVIHEGLCALREWEQLPLW
jgi:hypothetical protein